MSNSHEWSHQVWPFAVVLALSLAIAWLFANFDLISGTLLGTVISYLYFPGAMFSAFLVCGIHGGSVPEFICYFAGVLLETLVIWVILRVLWHGHRASS
jgi:hypothetical protein